MRYCKLGHVVILFAQRDEVVVDSCLVFSSVVEIETFCLHIILSKLLALELCNLLENALLVSERHAPDHDDAVVDYRRSSRSLNVVLDRANQNGADFIFLKNRQVLEFILNNKITVYNNDNTRKQLTKVTLTYFKFWKNSIEIINILKN